MAPFLQESVSVDTFEPPSLDSLKIENANIKSCKIVGPLAWEGEQFKHESDYTYQLSEEEIHEIDEALSNFNGLSLHVCIYLDEPGTNLTSDLGLDGDEANQSTFILLREDTFLS